MLANALQALGASKRLKLSLYNRIPEFAIAMTTRLYTILWARIRYVTQKVLAWNPGAGWPATASHKLPAKSVVPAFINVLQEGFGFVLVSEFDVELSRFW